MAGKSTTDRKGKGKDTKAISNEVTDDLAAFTLPESLPCSEVSFPILLTKAAKASWKDILDESNRRFREIEEFTERKKELVPKAPFLKTECDYIKNEVFIYLIPALEETLNKAKIWEALKVEKCFFNGIDHIVQVLWNNNPRHPARKERSMHLFNMPWVRRYLEETPRPFYPKSWLWPENHAATIIQKTVRQYFVQREEEVQEMREFWKKLNVEKKVPEINTNPFLAKKFASASNVQRN